MRIALLLMTVVMAYVFMPSLPDVGTVIKLASYAGAIIGITYAVMLVMHDDRKKHKGRIFISVLHVCPGLGFAIPELEILIFLSLPFLFASWLIIASKRAYARIALLTGKCDARQR